MLTKISLIKWFILFLVIDQCFINDFFEVQRVQSFGFCHLDLHVSRVEDLTLVLSAPHHERFLKFVDARYFCKV